VTFLFTDIEGSTRRWEADAQAMRAALIAHDEVLRTAIEAHDGFLFSHTVMVWLRHSPRRGPLSTRLLTPSAHLSASAKWVSRLGRRASRR